MQTQHQAKKLVLDALEYYELLNQAKSESETKELKKQNHIYAVGLRALQKKYAELVSGVQKRNNVVEAEQRMHECE